MSRSDVAAGEQMLSLEARAVRRLNATATLTLRALGRSHSVDTARSALSQQMAAAVLDIRSKVREQAAEQFETVTRVATVVSGASDRFDAKRAGAAYAKAWFAKASGASGGASGGGGSTDSWDDATNAAESKIRRIAAYEVADAWNDEHRRNADAHPELKFVERWSAILDTHLCLRCRRMHGRIASPRYAEGFAEGWPPLHGDCRCQIITTVA